VRNLVEFRVEAELEVDDKVEAQVGDRVEVKDEETEDWGLGVVNGLSQGATNPTVRRDGWDANFEWKFWRFVATMAATTATATATESDRGGIRSEERDCGKDWNRGEHDSGNMSSRDCDYDASEYLTNREGREGSRRRESSQNRRSLELDRAGFVRGEQADESTDACADDCDFYDALGDSPRPLSPPSLQPRKHPVLLHPVLGKRAETGLSSASAGNGLRRTDDRKESDGGSEWIVMENTDAFPGENKAILPLVTISAAKAMCERKGLGGFTMKRQTVFLRDFPVI
jgi:hypothetical protein